MRQENDTIYGIEVARINRTRAKDIYDNGGTIYLLPININIKNSFMMPLRVDKGRFKDYGNPRHDDFHLIISEYEYYNCCNETGYYCKYFCPIEVI